MITGLVYPLAITGIAQVIFPHQANGSLVRDGNRIIGSELIAQGFAKPEYFHPRPSAAGKGYDASASSGSNLGPTSKQLAENIKANIDQARTDGVTGPVPADMVTASGLASTPISRRPTPLLKYRVLRRLAGFRKSRSASLSTTRSSPGTLGFLGRRTSTSWRSIDNSTP